MSANRTGKFRGLFWRFFAISFLCILVPMLVSMITAGELSNKYFEELSSNALLSSAAEKRNQLEQALTNIERQAQSIAKEPFIVDTLSKAKANSADPDSAALEIITQNLEDNFALADGLFENIFLMYKNRAIADSIKGKSVGWEDETVGSTESLLVRNVRLSPATGRPVLTIVAPIKKEKHLGTIAMAIELLNVSQKIIESDTSEENVQTLILNSAGLVISSANPEHVFALDFQNPETGLQDFYQTISSEKTGVGFFNLEGTEYIAGYSHSSKYDMYILTYKPVKVYKEKINNLRFILSGVTIAAIITASVIIYLYSRRITRPILAVTEQAEQLAGGNLAMTIPEASKERKDELGRLSGAFANMVRSLREIIMQIAETSEQVAASSQQLYASGEQVGKAAENVGSKIMDIASGAQEQSAQIDSALSDLSKLMVQIAEVNNKTDTMEKATAHILNDISAGNRSVAESIERINKLKASTEEISKVITELGNNSNQIGEIIELISGISEQTNLLALNAAIEAARAGESGRGFSVVADEIRKLAEESADASGRIARLIVEVRNGVDTAVDKMDDSIQSVDSCVGAIEENGRIFSEINEQAEHLKDAVADVTRSVRNMTENSGSFERIMQEINAVSREFVLNAQDVSSSSEEQVALTEEIASFAKALASMAEELSGLVNKFRLQNVP